MAEKEAVEGQNEQTLEQQWVEDPEPEGEEQGAEGQDAREQEGRLL